LAYDKILAQRVRDTLRQRREVTEKELFGGIGFMIRGNMACGVLGNGLLVRVGPAKQEEALRDHNAKEFAIAGRPSKGWVLVARSGTKTDTDLRKWVELGVAFAKSLPAK
jgi:TfoX/Sxy family transcriptional regulator of competence genes